MALSSLSISNLRNIYRADLQFSPKLNFIVGPNASGKTSLLEAMHFLGSTRSFRSRIWQEYLSHDEKVLSVSGEVCFAEHRTRLGVQRHDDSVLMKINGAKVSKVSDLAVWLPIQLIHPDSHSLISGGPKIRRQYLDWGVFHVEPSFFPVWQRYDRTLKQRNALLRQKGPRDKTALRAWNPELDFTSEQINLLRKRYLEEINDVLPKFSGAMVGEHAFHIDYSPGWETSKPLSKTLEQKMELDFMRGFTHYGPHRADWAMIFDGRPAKVVLSRGQQKMLVIALLLAQIDVFVAASNKQPILLIDDLGAELDQTHCESLLNILQGMPVQIFITSTNRVLYEKTQTQEKKLFEIEGGTVAEVL